MNVKNYDGKDIDFEAAMNLMDRDICNIIEDEGLEPQQYIERYAEEHAKKYDGEEFAPYYGLAW